MEKFGKFCLSAVLIIVTGITSGYVLLNLYGWFVVPISNLRPITLLEAIGLSYVFGFFLMAVTVNMTKEKPTKSLTEHLVGKAIECLFFHAMYFTLGYIVHSMM